MTLSDAGAARPGVPPPVTPSPVPPAAPATPPSAPLPPYAEPAGAVGPPPWYRRTGVIIASLVVAVMGVALLAFGAISLSSASSTRSEADDVQAQVAKAQTDKQALEQERDAKKTESQKAADKAAALEQHTKDLKAAITSMHRITHDTVVVYNSFDECSNRTGDPFIQCFDAWVQRFDAATAAQLRATDDARKAAAVVQEDLRG